MAGTDCVALHAQLASIMENLANAAVAEICKLVDDGYAILRLEVSESHKQINTLKRKLQIMKARNKRQCGERTVSHMPNGNELADSCMRTSRGSTSCRGGRFQSSENREIDQYTSPWTSIQGDSMENKEWNSNMTQIMNSGEPEAPQIKAEICKGGSGQTHVKKIDVDKPGTEDPPASPRHTSLNEGHPDIMPKTEPQMTDHIYQLEDSESGNGEGHLSFDCNSWSAGSKSESTLTATATSSCHTDLLSLGLSNEREHTLEHSGNSPSSPDWRPSALVADNVPIKVEADANADWNTVDLNDMSFGTGAVHFDSIDKHRGGTLLSENRVVKSSVSNTTMECRTNMGSTTVSLSSNSALVGNDSLETTSRGDIRMPLSKSRRGGMLSSFHSGKVPFRCLLCGKHFYQMANLKRHERVHTGEKPFGCVRCSKRFSHRHQLKTHERVHTGEKPFLCTYCGKRFTQSSHLKTHLSVHMPYSCVVCAQRFTSKDDFLKHHTCLHIQC